MNKKEFISRLSQKIDMLPYEEKKNALSYYEEILDDAGPEQEESVISGFGPIDELAENILRDSGYFIETNEKQDKTDYQQNSTQNNQNPQNTNTTNNSGISRGWLIVLIIVSFPFWIPVVATFFGLLIGLIGAVFGISIACFAVPVGLFIAGCVTLPSSPVIALLLFGICLVFLGILFIIIPLLKWLFRMLGKGFGLIGRMFKNIFGKVGVN